MRPVSRDPTLRISLVINIRPTLSKPCCYDEFTTIWLEQHDSSHRVHDTFIQLI